MIDDVFERYVKDKDPFKIEKLWRTIYSSGYTQRPDISLLGIISGIEMACWDIIGKELNKPVIFHNRDADQDVVSILSEFPDVIGVAHCFSSNLENHLNMNLFYSSAPSPSKLLGPISINSSGL